MNLRAQNKFIVSLLLLLIASFLQFNFKLHFGWTPEFAMATLVVFGFYLGFLEIAFLCALGVFLFNWMPLPGFEILFFFLLPFLVLSARKIFPWKSEVNNVLIVSVSAFLFYAISDWSVISGNAFLFGLILIGTAAFGAAIFQILNYFYKLSPI
ncbi:MAG: hypothetical protein HY432_00080 [Candidatus Liptonbacteria bacterium]|nr:hypothetical protein [Candidatus Liptonbacteria bacterium]